ncbi:uncharacterized protein G2W53_025629 [Senna tora]|uniref:Uncharacterized protein n=1 Tax=Senna tora TaxID=362788 RepID=A0A834WKG1_9FABA|nr:uncharacterized protein G2W53_025629 [Senna tora]
MIATTAPSENTQHSLTRHHPTASSRWSFQVRQLLEVLRVKKADLNG